MLELAKAVNVYALVEGSDASISESTLANVTAVKEGTSGGTVAILKSDIVGTASNESTGLVYAGAKLEGSEMTCDEIAGTAGATATIDKASGSLSPNGLLLDVSS